MLRRQEALLAPAVMLRIVWIALGALLSAFRSRRDLLLEVVALRQQLAAFKARGKRPHIRTADRAFWVVLRRLWGRWADVLVINHREVIAAMDFFVVFTVSFRLLHVLFTPPFGLRGPPWTAPSCARLRPLRFVIRHG